MLNRKYTIWIEFLLIFIVLATAFLVTLEQSPFHPDENMWLNQSYHFEDFFTGNFSPIANQKLRFALTMPTIPEYVVGLSRKMGGYEPSQLNEIWDWSKSYDENKASGHIPSPKMLWWARFLPSCLSIVSILATFYLMKSAFNARVGYIWLILTLVNGWLILELQRAMGESPLLFNIMVAALAGYFAMKSFENSRYSLFWLVIFGIFTGLAGQSKMNGLAIFASGLVILILLTRYCQVSQRWRFFLIGLAGLSISTFIFFIGPNPFLWRDPIGRTIQTYQYRVEIMHGMQAIAFPQIVIKSWKDGVQIALSQIFKSLASLQFTNANYLNMLFAGFGLFILISKAWKSNMLGTRNPAALVILLVGLFASVPSLFTPLNIDRYYMLPVYFVSILIALGIDWFLRYISQIEPADNTLQPEA